MRKPDPIRLETMRDANYFAMCPICGDIRPNTVTHYDVLSCYECGATTNKKPLQPNEDWVGLRPCATIYETVLNPFRPVNMLDALIAIIGLSNKALHNKDQHGTETKQRRKTLIQILKLAGLAAESKYGITNR